MQSSPCSPSAIGGQILSAPIWSATATYKAPTPKLGERHAQRGRLDANRIRAQLALVLLLSAPAIAADKHIEATNARIGQVEIHIPSGFTGPQRKFPNGQSELHTYVEIVSKGQAPTIFQMIHITVPQALPDLSEEDRYIAASHFMAGFMSMFEQSTTKWSRSASEKIRLGGHIAARAKWIAHLNGIPSTGTMYLLVLGRDSYSFHVYGSAAQSNSALRVAVEAIERLSLDSASKPPKPSK